MYGCCFAAASGAKSRHCSRRPSPTTAVVAAAIVEPEPEEYRAGARPSTDVDATDDSGIVDEQRLHVGLQLPVHGAGKRLTVTTANDTTVYRSTGNIAVISSDTCTLEPSSSTKETTVDNSGSGSTGGRPGIYKKAAVAADSRTRPRHFGLAAAGGAEKSGASELSTVSGATASSGSTGLPKITASAFWDMIMGRGWRSNAMSESERRRRKLQKKNENRARKALRTITIILGAFVLCWTPWHVLSVVMARRIAEFRVVVNLSTNPQRQWSLGRRDAAVACTVLDNRILLLMLESQDLLVQFIVEKIGHESKPVEHWRHDDAVACTVAVDWVLRHWC